VGGSGARGAGARGAEVRGSTSDYVAGPGELLTTVSRMITLFPGDVMTLGATSARVRVTREEYAAGLDVTAGVEGLGTIAVHVTPDVPDPRVTAVAPASDTSAGQEEP
jgi:hypothetical protein